MILITVVSCLALLAWTVSQASAPAGDRSRARDTGRRARRVARHPQHVNSGDIERLLLEASLPASEARLVVERASKHGIKPFTMWMWIQQYDARTLALVVTADLTHADLLTHLGQGTVPDLRELQVFASLNGLTVTGRPVRTPVRAPVVRRTSLRGHELGEEPRRSAGDLAPGPDLPPIFEPGSWPYSEWDADGLSTLPDFHDGLGPADLVDEVARTDRDDEARELPDPGDAGNGLAA